MGPKTTAGFQSGGHLFGAEYSMEANDPFSKANTQSLQDNDVPCAVCLVASRPTKLMVPGRLTCPGGWTKEYSGYLMAQRYLHKGRTTYVCGQRPGSYRRRSGKQGWSHFHDRRGCMWFIAVSQLRTRMGNHVCRLYQIKQ